MCFVNCEQNVRLHRLEVPRQHRPMVIILNYDLVELPGPEFHILVEIRLVQLDLGGR